MAVQWGLGVPQGNAGDAFQQSYQNALLQGQQAQDRQMQMQQREQAQVQQKQQQQVQLTERHRQDIRLGAGIARQYEQRSGRPMDEAGWQVVRQAAQQAGADLTDVPEHFDPQYYQGLLSAAQTLEANSRDPYTLNAGDRRFDGGNNVIAEGGPDVTHQPNIQREVAYYRSIGRDDLAQQLLRRHAEGPPMALNNGDGTYTIVPPSQIQGGGQGGQPPPQRRTATNRQTGEQITVEQDPQTGEWRPVTEEAPAFRPAPGGPAPRQGNFPQ